MKGKEVTREQRLYEDATAFEDLDIDGDELFEGLQSVSEE